MKEQVRLINYTIRYKISPINSPFVYSFDFVDFVSDRC